MLYTKHNISDLDLTKYTRFVTIGCSFTRWRWPTWADCLAQEMPNAKHINLARGGAGNTYINSMLNIVSREHNFGPETLVGIMWSTISREDRFIVENPKSNEIFGTSSGWYTPGNIMGINDPNLFIRTDALEPSHYLVRDLALISSANSYLRTAKFDTLNACSLDMDSQISDQHGHSDRFGDKTLKMMSDHIRLYKDLDDDFVGYMITNGEPWPEGHTYPLEDNPNHNDYHPRSTDYVKYLESWGIPLSDSTKSFAQKATNDICEITDPEWQTYWPWNDMPPGDERIFLKDLF